MKTTNFVWLLGLTLILVFTGCNKEEEGTDNLLSKNYFNIENASYSTGQLPEGEKNIIKNLHINQTAINGGSSIVTFSSSEIITTIYISVVGVDGYYKYNFPKPSDPGQLTFDYQLLLLLSQNLINQNFAILISCETEDGTISKPVNSNDIKVVEVGTGKLQVSLSWDQSDDVDLHLFEPNGNEICYMNYFSSENPQKSNFEFYCYLVEKYTSHNTSHLNYSNEGDWDIVLDYLYDISNTITFNEEATEFAKNNKNILGFLDLDSNPDCSIDGINNENITYINNPLSGTYTIAIDLYRKCDYSRSGSNYSVTVNYNGKSVTVSNKQMGKFSNNYTGSRNNPEKYITIGTFTIDGNNLRSMTSEEKINNKAIMQKMEKIFKK